MGEPCARSSFIRPETLIELVWNTAPYLKEWIPEPDESFLNVILGWVPDESLGAYFRLCIACHHATAATFVPTDVDTKIRGLLWRETRDLETLRRMTDDALAMGRWSARRVSKRNVLEVSGHNGEWLSVVLAAHGRLLQLGDPGYAEMTGEAVHVELEREAAVFLHALKSPGIEIDVLKLAASITHNLGDIDQAISFWESRAATAQSRERFGRLAHENAKPYRGAFQLAAKLYRENLSAEGHRHYPLRAVKPLRKSPDLLLPLGPFFDEWGGVIATHDSLSGEDRAEVLDALVKGCRKIANQRGYFRAIAGFQAASGKNFERAVALLPAASRKDLRDGHMRKLIAVPRHSFESALIKRAAALRSARP